MNLPTKHTSQGKPGTISLPKKDTEELTEAKDSLHYAI